MARKKSGRKTSVYLSDVADQQIAAAASATGKEIAISRLVSESAALYGAVLVALADAPACNVRYSPTGWVVTPAV